MEGMEKSMIKMSKELSKRYTYTTLYAIFATKDIFLNGILWAAKYCYYALKRKVKSSVVIIAL